MSSSNDTVTVIQTDALPKEDGGGLGDLHYVPATLDPSSSGSSRPVKEYFARFISEEKLKGEEEEGGKKLLRGTFRGRPLDGVKQEVPEGHKVVVVQSGRGDIALESEGGGEDGVEKRRNLRAVSTCSSFTDWNFDRVPSEHDQLRRAIKHIGLARVIHGEDE